MARAQRRSAPPLRANRDFRRLWVAEMLSDVGSSASSFVTPLLVLALTGSPLLAGAVGACGLAAYVILALPAGALADRWDRRRAMLAANGLRLAGAVALAVTIAAGVVSVPILIVVAVLTAAGSALFGPAHSAALRHIVPSEQLGAASATDEARGFVAELVGPPLGGTLFGVARSVPYLADAASFLASLWAVALLRVRLRDEDPPPAETTSASVAEGLRFVWRQPFLRILLIIAPLANVALTGVLFALVVTLRQRGLAAGDIGLVQASAMAGGLLGAALAGRLLARTSPAVLIVVESWVAVLAVVVLALLPGTYLLAAPLFALIVLGPAANGAFFAHQVKITPDHLQGRVQGATGMLSQALSPLGPLLAGALVELTGQRGAFLLFAALLAGTALLATLSPAIWAMRTED